MINRSKIWLFILCAFLILLYFTGTVSAAEPLLTPGTKSNLVRTVQNYLRQLNYMRHTPTGYYGIITREAVKSFQLEHDLPANGIIDTDTFNALQSALFQKDNFTEYITQPEENLVDIAAKFNTSIAAIMIKNSLSSNEITVGQKLKIPSVYCGISSPGSRNRPGKVQPIPWSIVDQLWKKGEIARIIDVDTGKSFQVKRFCGYYHADVEPLTKYDTKTFLEIYGGHWSWTRRAVIVQIHNLYIAASTNGMPHGRQSIYNNNFHGQFCTHFLGSRIHQDNRVDPEHLAMIKKAAATSFPLQFIANSADNTGNSETVPGTSETDLSNTDHIEEL